MPLTFHVAIFMVSEVSKDDETRHRSCHPQRTAMPKRQLYLDGRGSVVVGGIVRDGLRLWSATHGHHVPDDVCGIGAPGAASVHYRDDFVPVGFVDAHGAPARKMTTR